MILVAITIWKCQRFSLGVKSDGVHSFPYGLALYSEKKKMYDLDVLQRKIGNATRLIAGLPVVGFSLFTKQTLLFYPTLPLVTLPRYQQTLSELSADSVQYILQLTPQRFTPVLSWSKVSLNPQHGQAGISSAV